MPYVDGFVVPVPKSKIDAYRDMARTAGEVWREYGALEYRECIADDVKPGQVTSFPQSDQLKPDESSCSRGSSTRIARIATRSTTR